MSFHRPTASDCLPAACLSSAAVSSSNPSNSSSASWPTPTQPAPSMHCGSSAPPLSTGLFAYQWHSHSQPAGLSSAAATLALTVPSAACTGFISSAPRAWLHPLAQPAAVPSSYFDASAVLLAGAPNIPSPGPFVSVPPSPSVSPSPSCFAPVQSWSPSWSSFAAYFPSSRATPAHGAFSWSVPAVPISRSVPSPCSTPPLSLSSVAAAVAMYGDASCSSRRLSSSSLSLSLSAVDVASACVPWTPTSTTAAVTARRLSASVSSASGRMSSSRDTSSAHSWSDSEANSYYSEDGSECSSPVSVASSSASSSASSGSSSTLSSSSCSDSGSDGSESDTAGVDGAAAAVRRHYSMSAFHSSAHRCPVAVLSFHTQRQYTVRSCDMRSWSRAELQADVAVSVRVMWDGSRHWFVAKDVCALIGKRVGSVGRAIYVFNRREKARMIVEQQQQLTQQTQHTGDDAMCVESQSDSAARVRPLVQVMSVLSEAGVKRLLSRTRSERAREVQHFIDTAMRNIRQSTPAAHEAETDAAQAPAVQPRKQRTERKRKERRVAVSDGQTVLLADTGDENKRSGSLAERVEHQRQPTAQQKRMTLLQVSAAGVTPSAHCSTQRINSSYSGGQQHVDVVLPPLHSASNSAFGPAKHASQQHNADPHSTTHSATHSTQTCLSASVPAASSPLVRAAAPTFRPIVLHHSAP